MPNTFKVLSRGTAPTGLTTVYTVPAATTTLVNNILASNPLAATQTFSIFFADVVAASAVSVLANDTTILDIKQVLTTGNTIKVLGTGGLGLHISGLEIT